MLSEYAKHLEGIRNGLIQRGVIFPIVQDFSSAGYFDIFVAGEQLAELMYFYKIMEYTGNMEPMFSDIQQTYKGVVRTEAFREFEDDILPMLRELYGDDDSSFGIHSICDLEGALSIDDEEPEEWVNEDLGAEDVVVDLEDLFGDSSEDEDPEGFDAGKKLELVSSGLPLWGISEEDSYKDSSSELRPNEVSGVETSVEYVPNGIDLFSIGVVTANATQESDVEYVPNGTELFNINVDDIDVLQESSEEYIAHGTDLFSIVTDTEVSSSLEDRSSDLWEESSEEDWSYDEEEDAAFVEEDDPDDLWEESSEEDWFYDEEEEEIIVPADEEVFDVWVSDPEEDDVDVITPVDPEEDFSSWGEEEEDLEEDFEEAPLTESPPENKPLGNVSNFSNNPKPIPTNIRQEDADIVDLVQEAASAALTSAKRILKGIVTPKK